MFYKFSDIRKSRQEKALRGFLVSRLRPRHNLGERRGVPAFSRLGFEKMGHFFALVFLLPFLESGGIRGGIRGTDGTFP
jgi:hypothetical protein